VRVGNAASQFVAKRLLADRLEHLDRGDLCRAALVSEVIRLEYAKVEAVRALACQRRLLGRDREPHHAVTVFGGCEVREATSATADLEPTVSGGELELLADAPVPCGCRGVSAKG